jgi:uncharacterized membrane protein
MEHQTESEVIDAILDAVEYVAVALEVLAVAIIVIGVVWATYAYLGRFRQPSTTSIVYRRYRERLGRALQLGLEVLVAADVVRTVALDPTLESVAVLGLLVLVRTFLSWSLEVEIENRWPWQERKELEGGTSSGRET